MDASKHRLIGVAHTSHPPAFVSGIPGFGAWLLLSYASTIGSEKEKERESLLKEREKHAPGSGCRTMPLGKSTDYVRLGGGPLRESC
jgi:hypothetical protein